MSILPEELSTKNTFLNEGTEADSTFFADRSGEICFSKVIFSLVF